MSDVNLVTMDLLVHTWDVARAVGADESLHPQAVADAYEMLKPMDAMIRMPRGSGPRWNPPPGPTCRPSSSASSGEMVIGSISESIRNQND